MSVQTIQNQLISQNTRRVNEINETGVSHWQDFLYHHAVIGKKKQSPERENR